MRLQKSLRLAVNILLHSKLRSWLTIIGIVIGVAAIVSIVSIGEGAKANVQDRLGGLGADIITVSPGAQRATGGFRGFGGGGGGGNGGGSGTTTADSKNLTDDDVQIIRSVEGVLFINGVVSGRAQMTYLAESSSVSVQGVDALAWQQMTTSELETGRFLTSSDTNAIVVGHRIASTLFKQPLAINRNVIIEGKLFKIVGILKESGGIGGDDNSVIMPEKQAREVLEKEGDSLDSIIIKTQNTDAVDYVMNATDARLAMARHVTTRNKDYTISSSKSTLERITDITQTFTIFLLAIAAVSLIVGAVGIANTMFTAVIEKTKEIGIMKAIGAKNTDIMVVFLLNSGLVGLVGGILGIALGAGISSLLPNLVSGFGTPGSGGGLRTVIPLSLLIEALIISILIGMVSGAIPAYRASKLKPVDALRYE